ncbi:MAG: 2Fe-2S iron-sulfur cluster-binding protein [Sumerlaeia bacterium]
MKNLNLVPGKNRIQCVTNAPLSDSMLVEQLNLPMACGGNGLCATCHVVVTGGMDNLSEPSSKELRTLNRLTGRCEGSRLACQARILGDVTVRLPEGIYITGTDDLESLIGRRAEAAILHPADGRVLVNQGQIISRYIIRKLEGMNFNPWDVAAGEDEGGKQVV